MTAAPPSDLEDHVGFWLRMVSNAVSQSFAGRVEAAGVTVAEWVFLRALYGADGIAPSELAERMGMTRGAISKLADRLVEKALVVRHADPKDRRGQSLVLSPAARPQRQNPRGAGSAVTRNSFPRMPIRLRQIA